MSGPRMALPQWRLRRRHGTVTSPICATLLLRSLSEPLNSIQSRYWPRVRPAGTRNVRSPPQLQNAQKLAQLNVPNVVMKAPDVGTRNALNCGLEKVIPELRFSTEMSRTVNVEPAATVEGLMVANRFAPPATRRGKIPMLLLSWGENRNCAERNHPTLSWV